MRVLGTNVTQPLGTSSPPHHNCISQSEMKATARALTRVGFRTGSRNQPLLVPQIPKNSQGEDEQRGRLQESQETVGACPGIFKDQQAALSSKQFCSLELFYVDKTRKPLRLQVLCFPNDWHQTLCVLRQ